MIRNPKLECLLMFADSKVLKDNYINAVPDKIGKYCLIYCLISLNNKFMKMVAKKIFN
jgi:ribonuclease HIII